MTISAHIFINTCLGEELEEFQFSERSQAKQCVIERKDLLNRHLSPGWLVEGSSNSAVCTLSNGVQ